MLLANSLVQIRGPRQPERTDFPETQHNNQSHWSYVPEPIPGDKSRPPVGQPDARHVSFLHDGKIFDCRTQLALQVSPPHQYSEYPDVPTTDVSLHRVCLAVIG